jgi:phytoene dehydrogenase-like protein
LFSESDAESLRRWRAEFQPILREILIPESQSPPVPAERRRALLEASAAGRRLLEVSRWSPLEFVDRHFRHPLVRAGLLFFNGLREVDLRLPGFGHHIPALLASDTLAQVCVGGSRRLAEALVTAVTQSGGAIATGVQPHRILVQNGRATGVETRDGRLYQARRFVVSSLNPQQTFLELLSPADLPAAWRTKAAQFGYNLIAPLFSLNLNLREPPRYRAFDAQPHLQDALMVIVGLEDDQQFHEIVAHHEAGKIPPAVMWGACPTRFDASQAPAGHHTAFMWEKVPYRLQGDARNWDHFARQHALRMEEVWCQYAPNLADAVLDRFPRTPLDTERRLPNMKEGDLLVGAFARGQVGYHRPFPGAGHYRTHLDGLYLCGSCCHPGGNITGLPGYNCAQVLLADLGLPRPSTAPPIEERLAGLV